MTRIRKRYEMEWSWAVIVATVVLAVVGIPGSVVGQQIANEALMLVFDSVTVVDVEQGRLVPDQRVVIAGNRIQDVGAVDAVPLPRGAQVVSARGKYLIPGLWDLHVHMNRIDKNLLELLTYGVTGVREAHTGHQSGSAPSEFSAYDRHVLARREILAGRQAGPPRQILTGPSIGCTPSPIATLIGNTRHGMNCASSFDSADARHVVEQHQAAGVDMIKTYELTRRPFFVFAAAARAAGIPFGGHLAKDVTLIEASDSGARIIDHSAFLAKPCLLKATATVAQCQEVAEHFRRNGTWWVPTIIGPNASGKNRKWSLYVEPLLHIVQRVRLPIMAGTDAGISSYGKSLHTELALYVARGLTPLEALQTATINPAKFLHGTDSLGTVAPGKLADLVLLDADPLTDITNTTTIRAVMANGRYFDRAALDQLMATAQRQP